jgi:CxxC motif-containing protein (DUF1111 family)
VLPAAFVLTVVLAVMGAAAAYQLPPDAPAGFDNETNGFKDQKTFDADKAAFDETEEVFQKDAVKNANGCVVKEEVRGGLGPIYNSTSCTACHQNAGFVERKEMTPGKGKFANVNPPDSNPKIFFSGNDAVSGTSSQVSEIRAGHDEVLKDEIFFRDAPGGSVIQQRAIDPSVQERVPVEENIRTLRIATSVLGDGFVESIPDSAIWDVRKDQARLHPDMVGFAVCVPAVIDVKKIENGQPTDFFFEGRIGRFGWKNQESSLMNFAAGAYVAEMGITSPLQPKENSFLGRPAPVAAVDPLQDPEDRAELPRIKFGKDVEAFARFMRSTKVPPRGAITGDVVEGEKVFKQIGCNICHVDTFHTAPEHTQFGDLTVDSHLGGKTIHPYSDFLLHDVGTGDGIVQTQYAEFPPFPIAEGAVIHDKRLNALLQCKREDIPNDRLRLQNRSKDITALAEVGETPAIQVVLPTGTSLRVGDLSGLAMLSLRDNAPFEMPLLYTITTANMIRTAPLWGLRTRPQLLHDGRALTLEDAIDAHHNQGEKSRLLFKARPDAQKKQLIAFLNSL